MNTKYTRFLLMALSVAALSSCSTAYRTGQTPDDVYFSPARQQVARQQQQQDEYLAGPSNSQRYQGANSYNNYDDYSYGTYRNDRFLRMSMGNRMRLSAFNDYYWNDPYYSGMGLNSFSYNFNSPWNSYYYWNNYYNPYSSFSLYNPYYGGVGGGWYGGGVIVTNPSKTPVSVNNTVRPGAFNRSGYMNSSYNNNNLYLDRNTTTTRPTTSATRGRYNNTNNSYYNTNGNTNRRQSTSENYSNGNNNNYRSNNNNTSQQQSRSYEAPTRSYSPSSSGSSSGSSSSGSSGGGGGVSRPTR